MAEQYQPKGAAGFKRNIISELLPSKDDLHKTANMLAGIEEKIEPFFGQPYVHLISVPQKVQTDEGITLYGVFSNRVLVPPSYRTAYEGRMLSGTVQELDYSHKHDNIRLEKIMDSSKSKEVVGDDLIRHDWHDSLALGAYAGPRPDTHGHFIARQDGQQFKLGITNVLDFKRNGESVGVILWNGLVPKYMWHEVGIKYDEHPLGWDYREINPQVILVGNQAINLFFRFDQNTLDTAEQKAKSYNSTTEGIYTRLITAMELDPKEIIHLWKDNVWLHDLEDWHYEKPNFHKKEKLESIQKGLSVGIDNFFGEELLKLEGVAEVISRIKAKKIEQ